MRNAGVLALGVPDILKRWPNRARPQRMRLHLVGMLALRLAILSAFCTAPPAHAADATRSEMDAVLKRQGETVEQNRRKLDQSIRANESDRKRAMARAQRRLERDATSSSTARRK